MRISITTTDAYRIGGIAAVVLLALVGYWFFVSHVFNLERERQDLERQMLSMRAEEERSSEMAGFLESLTANRDRIDAYFIHPDAVVSVIETLEKIGSSTGAIVDISQVAVESDDAATKEGVLSVSVAARGTWRETLITLIALETLPFHSRVQSATLTTGDVPGGSGEWTLRANVSVTLRR